MSETNNTPQNPPCRPLWKRLLIGASFALNLLILGSVVGLVLARDWDDEDRAPRLGRSAPMIGLLPPKVRGDVMKDLRRVGRDHGISVRSFASNRREVAGLVRSTPFEPDVLVQTLNDDQMRLQGFLLDSHGLLAKALAEMTPEERQAYADRLERFHRFKHSRDGQRPPPQPR